MESNFDAESDANDARDTLAAIDSDRRRVGEAMTSQTWWAAPAQGFGTAILVAAPVFGLTWAWFPYLVSTLLFLAIAWYFRERTGLNISRPAGPRGMPLLIVLIVLLVASLAATVTLAIVDLRVWIIPVAALAGILTTLGVVAYDRVYAAEVRRA